MLLAKPRRKGVVTNGVTHGRVRGMRPRRNGRESIVGNRDTRMGRTGRMTLRDGGGVQRETEQHLEGNALFELTSEVRSNTVSVVTCPPRQHTR